MGNVRLGAIMRIVQFKTGLTAFWGDGPCVAGSGGVTCSRIKKTSDLIASSARHQRFIWTLMAGKSRQEIALLLPFEHWATNKGGARPENSWRRTNTCLPPAARHGRHRLVGWGMAMPICSKSSLTFPNTWHYYSSHCTTHILHWCHEPVDPLIAHLPTGATTVWSILRVCKSWGWEFKLSDFSPKDYMSSEVDLVLVWAGVCQDRPVWPCWWLCNVREVKAERKRMEAVNVFLKWYIWWAWVVSDITEVEGIDEWKCVISGVGEQIGEKKAESVHMYKGTWE